MHSRAVVLYEDGATSTERVSTSPSFGRASVRQCHVAEDTEDRHLPAPQVEGQTRRMTGEHERWLPRELASLHSTGVQSFTPEP